MGQEKEKSTILFYGPRYINGPVKGKLFAFSCRFFLTSSKLVLF